MTDECTIAQLPDSQIIDAAETAVDQNPQNAPSLVPVGAAGDFIVLPPERIAVLTSRKWAPKPTHLTVSFIEKTADDLCTRILSHMNAWARTTCITFVQAPAGTRGTVRITRNQGGYWSYLGTDILHIPTNQPTMCLEAFAMDTPESEYKRVVRHETGHTLGFPHEHMRKELVALLDPAKTYAYFKKTSGWDRATVDAQVFTTLDDRTLMETPPDKTSIMCYRFPGSITKDGQPIVGGSDIDPTDYAFAGKLYPKFTGGFDTI